MKRIVTPFLLSMLVLAAQAKSTENCIQRSRYLAQQGFGRPVKCFCGAEMNNVLVTLPQGLTLARVCDFHWDSDRRPIDLRKEKISLDHQRRSGDWLAGEILLRGDLRLSGRIFHQPSDGGDWWFHPNKPVLGAETDFESEFRVFALREGFPEGEHLLPNTVASMNLCYEAKAELLLSGFLIKMYESEGSGTSPIEVKIIRKSKFLPCKDNK